MTCCSAGLRHGRRRYAVRSLRGERPCGESRRGPSQPIPGSPTTCELFLARSLTLYQDRSGGRLPRRLVIHKTTAFKKEEIDGAFDALAVFQERQKWSASKWDPAQAGGALATSTQTGRTHRADRRAIPCLGGRLLCGRGLPPCSRLRGTRTGLRRGGLLPGARRAFPSHSISSATPGAARSRLPRMKPWL